MDSLLKKKKKKKGLIHFRPFPQDRLFLLLQTKFKIRNLEQMVEMGQKYQQKL